MEEEKMSAASTQVLTVN